MLRASVLTTNMPHYSLVYPDRGWSEPPPDLVTGVVVVSRLVTRARGLVTRVVTMKFSSNKHREHGKQITVQNWNCRARRDADGDGRERARCAAGANAHRPVRALAEKYQTIN
jgi:hypothetical protein